MSTATLSGEIGTAGAAGRERPQRRQTPVPAIVGALATIALGVAILASVITNNAASGDAARLQTQLSTLEHQLAATGRTLAATDRRLKATNRSLSAARGQLKTYRMELQMLEQTADTSGLWRALAIVQGTIKSLSARDAAIERRIEAKPPQLGQPQLGQLRGHPR